MIQNISYHVQADRVNRAVLIATKIGFGNVIKEKEEVDKYGRISWRQLTDTGIIIILDKERTFMVTFWIASLSQVKDMWGKGNLPKSLYKAVTKNKKLMKVQDKG